MRWQQAMRTNIELDDELIRKAMRASGTTTKRAAVEAALQLMVRLKAQEGARRLRGTVAWDGDLEGIRERRTFEPGF